MCAIPHPTLISGLRNLLKNPRSPSPNALQSKADDKGGQHKCYQRRYCKSTFCLAFDEAEKSEYQAVPIGGHRSLTLR